MARQGQVVFLGQRSRTFMKSGPASYTRNIRNIQNVHGRLAYRPTAFALDKRRSIRTFDRVYPNNRFRSASGRMTVGHYHDRGSSGIATFYSRSGFMRVAGTVSIPSLKYKRKTGNFYVTRNRAYRKAVADVTRGRTPSERIGRHGFTDQKVKSHARMVLRNLRPSAENHKIAQRYRKTVLNRTRGMRAGPQLTRAQRQAIAAKRRRVKGRFA